MKDFLLVFFVFLFLPEVQFQWLQQSQGIQITTWEKKNISQLALTTVTSSLRTLKHRFNESDLQKKNIWLSCLFLSSCSSSVKRSSDHHMLWRCCDRLWLLTSLQAARHVANGGNEARANSFHVTMDIRKAFFSADRYESDCCDFSPEVVCF